MQAVMFSVKRRLGLTVTSKKSLLGSLLDSKFAKSRDATSRCDGLLHRTIRITRFQDIKNSPTLEFDKNASNLAISRAKWSEHDMMGAL